MTPPPPTDRAQPRDARLFAPAAARNADPLLAVFAPRFGDARHVLEIASGSGEHAVGFARAMTHLTWHASDPNKDARASIQAWINHSGLTLPQPMALDVTAPDWADAVLALDDRIDVIVCINMIHIAPWSACLGLIDGAGEILGANGHLVLYGPFKIDGAHTADSNARFDQSLRAQDPSWGVRDLGDVIDEAARVGLGHIETIDMPANNKTVVFKMAP